MFSGVIALNIKLFRVYFKTHYQGNHDDVKKTKSCFKNKSLHSIFYPSDAKAWLISYLQKCATLWEIYYTFYSPLTILFQLKFQMS